MLVVVKNQNIFICLQNKNCGWNFFCWTDKVRSFVSTSMREIAKKRTRQRYVLVSETWKGEGIIFENKGGPLNISPTPTQTKIFSALILQFLVGPWRRLDPLMAEVWLQKAIKACIHTWKGSDAMCTSYIRDCRGIGTVRWVVTLHWWLWMMWYDIYYKKQASQVKSSQIKRNEKLFQWYYCKHYLWSW